MATTPPTALELDGYPFPNNLLIAAMDVTTFWY